MLKRPLILDIDFTLIHLEYVPGSIEVPGRTRPAWLAPRTVEILGELQDKFEIVLATARSWDGTRWVCDGLKECGVRVESVVIEDGARLGGLGNLRAFDAYFDAGQIRESLNVQSDWPKFEWQLDFQNCAVARCQNHEDAAQLMDIFANINALQKWHPRFYRDGRKVYILPKRADKWSALQRLLGERAARAAGVGDGANDLVWLPNIAFPATFGDADAALIKAVRARRGCIGGTGGHEAIVRILRNVETPAGGVLKFKIFLSIWVFKKKRRGANKKKKK